MTLINRQQLSCTATSDAAASPSSPTAPSRQQATLATTRPGSICLPRPRCRRARAMQRRRCHAPRVSRRRAVRDRRTRAHIRIRCQRLSCLILDGVQVERLIDIRSKLEYPRPLGTGLRDAPRARLKSICMCRRVCCVTHARARTPSSWSRNTF